ncbi:hypothetical protein MRX96_008047 [Rhipicephalus microplus]
MDPRLHQGRREARVEALEQTYAHKNPAYYVDAANYDHANNKAVATVVDHTLTERTSASVRCHDITDAEETAIALALALGYRQRRSLTVLTDSQEACRNYLQGRISQPAFNVILSVTDTSEHSITHALRIWHRIIWTPGHIGLEGNQAADRVARRASSEISSTTVYDVSAMYMVPLCAFNFFLMVASSVVFLSSLYAKFEPRDSGKHSFTAPSTFLVALLFNLENVLMVASGLLFLTAAVGLLGAVRENVFLLEVYQNVLMVLVVLTFGTCLLVAGMPWLAHAFIMDHVTEDFVVHYRDKADYKKVSMRVD